MRITRLFTTVLLAAATLTGTASAALADDPSSTPRPGESSHRSDQGRHGLP